MKKFVVIFGILVSFNSFAATVAKAVSPTGGEAQLTNESCKKKDKDLKFMFLASRNGNYITGCWKEFRGRILVNYSDGVKRLYQKDDFTWLKN